MQEARAGAAAATPGLHGVGPPRKLTELHGWGLLVAFLVIAVSGTFTWARATRREEEEESRGDLDDYANAEEPLLATKESDATFARTTVHQKVKNAVEDEANALVLPPVESFLRGWFYKQGVWIATNPFTTLLLTLLFVGLCLLGLLRFEVETNPENLWVPSGSTTKAEQDFFNKAFGKFYRIEQLILSRNDTSSNSSIVDDDTIRLMFDMQDIVGNISVPVGEGQNATLDDICFKPFGPSGNCATQSVLQYWQMDRNTFEYAASNHPNQSDWMEFCFQHWITEESCFSAFKAPMDPKLVFGGFPRDQGNIVYSNESTSLIVVYLVDNSEENLDAALAFEEKFIEVVQEKLVGMAEKHSLRLSYSSESSVQKELERESNADAMTVLLSFIAMFVYMTFVLGGARSCKPSLLCFRTRVLLGLGGVLLVVLSVLCAAGILSALGVKSTLLIVEVIPFLALAIGEDNMCILAHTLQCEDVNTALPIRVGNALSSAGTQHYTGCQCRSSSLFGWGSHRHARLHHLCSFRCDHSADRLCLPSYCFCRHAPFGRAENQELEDGLLSCLKEIRASNRLDEKGQAMMEEFSEYLIISFSGVLQNKFVQISDSSVLSGHALWGS